MRTIAGIEKPKGSDTFEKPMHRRIATLGIIVILVSLVLVGCNRSSELTFDDSDDSFTSIAHLKSLCDKASTPIIHEIKISGVVTANDIRSEFPKTLIIEDATAGIEIAVDHTALADLFPLGAQVTVYCSGLALGDYGGKVQLGARPTGAYNIDRIARADITRYIRCTDLNAGTRRPRTVQIGALSIDDADRYVHLDGVHFPDAEAPWCERDPLTGEICTTVRTLMDATGATLPVRIHASSHYASEPIPCGTGSVNGIVDWFNGEVSLRIVNYEIDLRENSITAATPPTTYPSTAGY